MKSINKTISILFLLPTLLTAVCGLSFGQVTIGSGIAPVKGALLDLKEKTPANPSTDNTTATKGLMLPRVNLSGLSVLNPILTGYSLAEALEHTGLTVWNTNGCMGVGVWTWSGNEWLPLQAVQGTGSAVTVSSQPVDILEQMATGVVTLSITPSGGTGSYTYQWYSTDAPGGAGTMVGNNSPTLDISKSVISDKYYWCEVTDGCTSARWTGEVRVTVASLPKILTSQGGSTSCGAGSATLSVTIDKGVARWFTNLNPSTGETPLHVGTTYSPSISSTTIFYAEAYDSSTGLASSPRTPVTAMFTPQPGLSRTGGSNSTIVNTSNEIKYSYTDATSAQATISGNGVNITVQGNAGNISFNTNVLSAGSYILTVSASSSATCTNIVTETITVNSNSTTPTLPWNGVCQNQLWKFTRTFYHDTWSDWNSFKIPSGCTGRSLHLSFNDQTAWFVEYELIDSAGNTIDSGTKGPYKSNGRQLIIPQAYFANGNVFVKFRIKQDDTAAGSAINVTQEIQVQFEP